MLHDICTHHSRYFKWHAESFLSRAVASIFHLGGGGGNGVGAEGGSRNFGI